MNTITLHFSHCPCKGIANAPVRHDFQSLLHEITLTVKQWHQLREPRCLEELFATVNPRIMAMRPEQHRPNEFGRRRNPNRRGTTRETHRTPPRR